MQVNSSFKDIWKRSQSCSHWSRTRPLPPSGFLPLLTDLSLWSKWCTNGKHFHCLAQIIMESSSEGGFLFCLSFLHPASFFFLAVKPPPSESRGLYVFIFVPTLLLYKPIPVAWATERFFTIFFLGGMGNQSKYRRVCLCRLSVPSPEEMGVTLGSPGISVIGCGDYNISEKDDWSLPFFQKIAPWFSLEKTPFPLSAFIDWELWKIVSPFANAHSPLSPWEKYTS